MSNWRNRRISALIPDSILERLSYDHETGIVSWRSDANKGRVCRHDGKPAGTKLADGYIQIKVDGSKYLAHRVAYALMRYNWPNGEIDHVNGIRDDNRWCNLRIATRAENKRNEKACTNKTGFSGVSRQRNKYRATVFADGRRVYNAFFDTAEEAGQAAAQARAKYHGDFAMTGRTA